ncbi:SHOCT domain-containing protein [Georgenia sp. AZ-5]|uniref:SHOCT domain-containing protein n=1 Tax=Georgenia sp. AZ-5 TaxID=3367526 RepID=UPI003754EBAF
MIRSEVTQDPLLPASYDIVWSAGVILVLVVATIAAVMLVRHVRNEKRRHKVQVAAPEAVEQVHHLAQLRDIGAITPQEYEARKNSFLGPI